ncbi:MAG: DUF2062 domain-containing protein [Deltaproteobacteria bacterium]|nr:DUF2062 domain-containing protein [Deltaproteobacteria bacterium]
MGLSEWRENQRRRQERVKSALRGTHLHRLLGEKVFGREAWRINEASLAGGLSLGLFVAFTPTIPFHMLLCAVGAVFLKVNLPVALAACWVTNPLTAVPIYMLAARLGKDMVAHPEAMDAFLAFFHFGGKTAKFVEQNIYIWSGSLVFSAVSAAAGNLGARIAWRVGRRMRNKAARRPGRNEARRD